MGYLIFPRKPYSLTTVGNRESCWHTSGSHNQCRFRSARNGLLFDNSLNIEGLLLKGRMENGYEEGCTRGAK